MINVGEDTDVSDTAGFALEADELLWIDDRHFEGVEIFSWLLESNLEVDQRYIATQFEKSVTFRRVTKMIYFMWS